MSPWQVGDMLEFTIYSKGSSGPEIEGTALLAGEEFYPNGFDGDILINGLANAMLRLRVLPVELITDGVDVTETTELVAPRNAAIEGSVVADQSRHALPQYDAEKSSLQVSIIQASGLEFLKLSGRSTHCVCAVKSSDGRAGPDIWRTKAATDSLSPTWNETKTVSTWNIGESLEFTIYDEGERVLATDGGTLLSSEEFYPNGFDGVVHIHGIIGASLRVRVLPVGQCSQATDFTEGLAPVSLHSNSITNSDSGASLQAHVNDIAEADLALAKQTRPASQNRRRRPSANRKHANVGARGQLRIRGVRTYPPRADATSRTGTSEASSAHHEVVVLGGTTMDGDLESRRHETGLFGDKRSLIED
jgi:hypothetical protein